MKAKQILLYLIIMVLASCKPEEQPPVISYVFSDVSVDAKQTSATITCRNESVDDDKVFANVLLSRDENITDATKYPLHLQNDTLRGNITGLERNTVYYFCFEVYTANEHKRANEVHHFETTSGGANVTVTTIDAINITQTSATSGGNVSAEGNTAINARGVCWDTVPNPDILQSPHLVSGEGAGGFMLNITGLMPGTTYYMRAYAMSNNMVYYGNEVHFTTQSAQLPTVTTGEVSNITRTSAQANGNVTSDGGAEVTRRGVCWSTAHEPSIGDDHADNGTGTGAYTVDITDLMPNTTYYVRAYAENVSGLSYGEEVEFTTAEDVSSPTVTTGAVEGTTAHGEVTSDGGAPVTERGICWGTEHSPTIEGTHATSGTGTGSFSVELTGLTPGTTYYVRAYAKNSVGTSYGNEVSFSTTANMPTVTTDEVSNITQTTAQGGGNVTDDGGATVTERGICWGTGHNPTTGGSHATSGQGTGAFVYNMTGLTQNTKYYVRAYAVNSQGTSYGEEVSFTTSQNVSAPTVTTGEVTDITQTSAKCSGNVTADGGAAVTERGICWSTSHNPTTSGSHATSGTGTGTFTCNMTGLTAGTIYYVRAYAKNSQGISYGSEVSFSTTANMPTVTTAQVTNITQTTATGGGNVTATGGANVTERGICWSTSHNPTTNSSHSSNGTGPGSYTCNMTGLTPNTTYYVRAYAKNSVGTAYGSEVSFTTTQNVTVPTVTTNTVTNITQTTATCGGNVTNSGGATVTARGVCWSTSQNPTVNNSHTTDGSGTGSFTSSITGLAPNTTYYVRAYATNSQGTAYGTQRTFTTTQSISTPTVTTAQVTNITQTTATGGGNVTATGGASVTDRGICWSTSHNPTISGSHASGGAGTGSFTTNMTGLTANTTYYVRAYATNSAGTAYGSEVSFTTLQNVTVPTVTTNQVTNITQTTATGGGNVTSAGGGTVTARGVCWSTSHNPTTSSSHTTDGSGTGSFTSSLTNLTPNTTYYVRAYATNSAGTAYGSEVSFITSQIPAYTISVSANPTNGGTVSGGGTYQQGQSCTVTATAATGYTFLRWTENGSQVSTNASYTFTVSGNRTLVAQFQSQSYTISVSANPNNGGTVSGGGTYNYGQSCTVTAAANSGYTFTNWTENGTQVSTNANYTFTVTGSRTLVAHFTAQPQAPTGAINGLFSVSATQQVYFSQGNLQYIGNAITPYWRFADNQWDYLGNNGQGSTSQNVDRDLFSWGTSGWNSGNTYFQPWDVAGADVGYLFGPPGQYDLTGPYANADWGVYNSIVNGGNTPNQWRTLTKQEWEYVLNTRNTASGIRYAKANVNNVNGVILLPDDWSIDTYSLINTNLGGAYYNNNMITASQWTTLENAGAVFLPASGARGENGVGNFNVRGRYWSASCYGTDWALSLEFEDSYLGAGNSINRCAGLSVRLVHDAQ